MKKMIVAVLVVVMLVVPLVLAAEDEQSAADKFSEDVKDKSPEQIAQMVRELPDLNDPELYTAVVTHLKSNYDDKVAKEFIQKANLANEARFGDAREVVDKFFSNPENVASVGVGVAEEYFANTFNIGSSSFDASVNQFLQLKSGRGDVGFSLRPPTVYKKDPARIVSGYDGGSVAELELSALVGVSSVVGVNARNGEITLVRSAEKASVVLGGVSGFSFVESSAGLSIKNSGGRELFRVGDTLSGGSVAVRNVQGEERIVLSGASAIVNDVEFFDSGSGVAGGSFITVGSNSVGVHDVEVHGQNFRMVGAWQDGGMPRTGGAFGELFFNGEGGVERARLDAESGRQSRFVMSFGDGEVFSRFPEHATENDVFVETNGRSVDVHAYADTWDENTVVNGVLVGEQGMVARGSVQVRRGDFSLQSGDVNARVARTSEGSIDGRGDVTINDFDMSFSSRKSDDGAPVEFSVRPNGDDSLQGRGGRTLDFGDSENFDADVTKKVGLQFEGVGLASGEGFSSRTTIGGQEIHMSVSKREGSPVSLSVRGSDLLERAKTLQHASVLVESPLGIEFGDGSSLFVSGNEDVLFNNIEGNVLQVFGASRVTDVLGEGYRVLDNPSPLELASADVAVTTLLQVEDIESTPAFQAAARALKEQGYAGMDPALQAVLDGHESLVMQALSQQLEAGITYFSRQGEDTSDTEVEQLRLGLRGNLVVGDVKGAESTVSQFRYRGTQKHEGASRDKIEANADYWEGNVLYEKAKAAARDATFKDPDVQRAAVNLALENAREKYRAAADRAANVDGLHSLRVDATLAFADNVREAHRSGGAPRLLDEAEQRLQSVISDTSDPALKYRSFASLGTVQVDNGNPENGLRLIDGAIDALQRSTHPERDLLLMEARSQRQQAELTVLGVLDGVANDERAMLDRLGDTKKGTAGLSKAVLSLGTYSGNVDNIVQFGKDELDTYQQALEIYQGGVQLGFSVAEINAMNGPQLQALVTAVTGLETTGRDSDTRREGSNYVAAVSRMKHTNNNIRLLSNMGSAVSGTNTFNQVPNTQEFQDVLQLDWRDRAGQFTQDVLISYAGGIAARGAAFAVTKGVTNPAALTQLFRVLRPDQMAQTTGQMLLTGAGSTAISYAGSTEHSYASAQLLGGALSLGSGLVGKGVRGARGLQTVESSISGCAACGWSPPLQGTAVAESDAIDNAVSSLRQVAGVGADTRSAVVSSVQGALAREQSSLGRALTASESRDVVSRAVGTFRDEIGANLGSGTQRALVRSFENNLRLAPNPAPLRTAGQQAIARTGQSSAATESAEEAGRIADDLIGTPAARPQASASAVAPGRAGQASSGRLGAQAGSKATSAGDDAAARALSQPRASSSVGAVDELTNARFDPGEFQAMAHQIHVKGGYVNNLPMAWERQAEFLETYAGRRGVCCIQLRGYTPDQVARALATPEQQEVVMEGMRAMRNKLVPEAQWTYAQYVTNN